jgi:hypothetical protein
LYGDQSGSPRRDSRQNPDAPWADGQTGLPPHTGPEGYPPSFGVAPTEDVRVAGSPQTAAEYPEFPMGPTVMPPTQEAATSSTAAFGPVSQSAFDGPGAPGAPGPAAPGPARRRPRGPQKAIKIAAVVAAFAVVTGGGIGAWAMTSGGGSTPVASKKTIQPKTMAAAMPPMTPAQIKAQQTARRKTMADEASRAARRQSIDTSFVSKGTKPTPSKSASTGTNSNGSPNMGDPTPSGTAQSIAKAMLSSFGWSPSSQFGCLVSLWNRESGWNTHASNPSGAYGIPQSLPGSKMASAGPDWQNNATTQIKWGLGYIKDRYSSPCGAWGHSQSTGWY